MSYKLDENERIELVIKPRFTLYELATIIASTYVCDTMGKNDKGEFTIGIGSEVKTIKQILSNKKVAMEIAQETLLIDGRELPTYRISDNGLEELREQVLDRLNVLWKK